MRRRHKDEGGAAAVEFALLFVPFVILIFATIQFAYYFWTAETTNSAAREVARRVVVGDCWGAISAYAEQHGGPGIESATVSPDPATLSVGDRITVEVVSDSNLGVLPFDFGLPATVTRSYEARMEVDAPSEDDACN